MDHFVCLSTREPDSCTGSQYFWKTLVIFHLPKSGVFCTPQIDCPGFNFRQGRRFRARSVWIYVALKFFWQSDLLFPVVIHSVAFVSLTFSFCHIFPVPKKKLTCQWSVWYTFPLKSCEVWSLWTFIFWRTVSHNCDISTQRGTVCYVKYVFAC